MVFIFKMYQVKFNTQKKQRKKQGLETLILYLYIMCPQKYSQNTNYIHIICTFTFVKLNCILFDFTQK